MIESINRDSRSLGWKAYNYTEFYGRKLKEGLQYRLGTFEPRVRVKSMSRLSNRLESLPKEFDALSHWSGLISEVRDQGWCGWVFTTYECLLKLIIFYDQIIMGGLNRFSRFRSLWNKIENCRRSCIAAFTVLRKTSTRMCRRSFG